MVVGWDGAPPEIAFTEHLPNLRRLMREGAYARLRSTHPPITVPAWSVMLTGQNPGRLGFSGFRNLTRGTYDGDWIAFADRLGEPRVWDLLGKAGKRVIVHGVPQTYPVSPVNGVLTSCFLTPEGARHWTHPPELAAALARDAGGAYPFDVPGFREKAPDRVLADVISATHAHHDAAERLIASEPWDFFMMVEMGPDRLQHALWRFHDPEHRKHEPGRERVIRDYYRVLDERLGRLLSLAGDDAVVLVVSDHGAQRMDGAINVNDALIDLGYLKLKRPPQGVEPLKPANVDWSRTRAWAMGGYYARIYVNLEGREPQGIVSRREYESTRESITRDLRGIPNDLGNAIATRVVRREDVYEGPFLREMPDLLAYFGDLRWRAHERVGHASLHSLTAEIGPDDATHAWDGIFVCRGTKVAGDLGTLDIRQVAPTILTCMDVDLPPTMETRSVLA